MATTTKRVPAPAICPPRDIRENTKARRAWLAEKLAEVLQQPNTEAKITGNGSYQQISVWTLVAKEGRERFRGVCQYCGNLQVVQDGVMVLHGYERPGDGMVYGRCAGVGHRPLNHSDVLTKGWLVSFTQDHANAQVALEQAEADVKAAKAAIYPNGYAGERLEDGAYLDKPRAPRYATDVAAVAEYHRLYTAWAKRFPLTAAIAAAEQRHAECRNQEWQLLCMVRHFTELLDRKAQGTPLTREVV